MKQQAIDAAEAKAEELKQQAIDEAKKQGKAYATDLIGEENMKKVEDGYTKVNDALNPKEEEGEGEGPAADDKWTF